MQFTDTKSETLNVTGCPTLKQVLKKDVAHQQRSMVNMLELLLGDYRNRIRITPSGPKAKPPVHKWTETNRLVHLGTAA